MLKIKELASKAKTKLMVGTGLAMSTLAGKVLAEPNTGNTDLDTLLGAMDEGTQTIKAGGLYIIGAVIVIAVIFFGARWLWNMWRSWLSRAQ